MFKPEVTMFQPTDIIHGIKATGSDGLSFASQYTLGKQIDYAAAIGQTVEVEAAPYDADQCAAGLHFSLRAIDCCRALGRMNPRPWRFFEVAVAVEDIVWPKLSDITSVDKLRARRIYVVREISHEEAFGFDLTARTKRCREIAGTFAAIPWLQPTRDVTDAEVVALATTWRERLAPYMAPGRELPSAVRLVRTREEAHAAFAAAFAAADDAAADDAAAAAFAAAAFAAAAAADAAAFAAADAAAADAADADAAAFAADAAADAFA
jgi:hypothetical protein